MFDERRDRKEAEWVDTFSCLLSCYYVSKRISSCVPSEQLITRLVPTQLSSTQLSIMATLLSGKPTCAKLLFSKCPSPALLSFAYIDKGWPPGAGSRKLQSSGRSSRRCPRRGWWRTRLGPWRRPSAAARVWTRYYHGSNSRQCFSIFRVGALYCLLPPSPCRKCLLVYY